MTDELPFLTDASAPATANGGASRRCRRHDYRLVMLPEDFGPVERLACSRCGAIRDEARARRGRTNRSRGNAIERSVAKAIGGKRVGQFGGADDVLDDGGMFAFQVKSRKTGVYPGWMSDELDKLRSARTDREPVLVVAEAPGPGHRARRLYVVDEKTWRALHGEKP